MTLKLTGRFEFAPLLLRKVFPKRAYLHELSVVELSEMIGWPIRKTRSFFGNHKNPNWEDILHVCNVLAIPVQELVEGMARYMMPTWKEEQDKYIKELKGLHDRKVNMEAKEYGKTLYNMVHGRYPVELQ